MFTLRDRMLVFFAQAPTEEVTVEDLRRKLGYAGTQMIRATLHDAQEAGWLFLREERDPKDRREVRRLICVTPEARDVFAAPLAPSKDPQ
jgi:hypothetical protein